MTVSVVMFCPQYRPLIGGAERQAERLATALVASGCRVTILTPRIDPDSPDREVVHGVVIERFHLNDLSRRFPVPGVALLNIPYVLWQTARTVRASLKGVQILHCHIGSLLTAGAALAGRWAGVPVLCKAASAGQRSDLGEIERAGTSGRLVSWLTRATIDFWVSTTEAVQQALVRAGVGSERIVLIPNGVELPTAPEDLAAKGPVRRFLYLGRLSRNANRDTQTLVRAFDQLAGTMPDLELALVGGGDLFEETGILVETCAARERIRLPGFDDPKKWLAWADCFVLPSRVEGLSNALLEAMAEGLPCIANDIPSNREVLNEGKAGILVPVGDRKALEEAMRRLIEDAGIAADLSYKAKERVERCYSLGAIADKYCELYESILTLPGQGHS
jgi:L-malate glycosyltransferase